MKVACLGLVLLVAAFGAHASGLFDRVGVHQGYSNAPVCPEGEKPVMAGVVDGHMTWRCVPV
ncbi:hypothetical protein P3W24_13520 [Luteibacter sp. PPL201]|uniref:Uncharacterized protein n=1 Tax=Luteibacter sahnii TaxID=3021977 RepID=A0ABT6BFM2_9GAMM|nr:hypothetical protein [Luteibacter sp. PPL193]MDY1549885.1 hypothetical protein [Luteibacter sp. PPL193]